MHTATSPSVAIPSSPTRHGTRGEHGREARRFPGIACGQQTGKKRCSKDISRAGGIHFRHLGGAEATAVSVPIQHGARGAFGHNQHARLVCHMFDQLIIPVYIFAADHNGASARQRGIGILPFPARHTAFRVPLTHPALGREPEQGRGKTIWQGRVHFVGDGTKMDDRGASPYFWHITEIKPCGLRAQVLNSSLFRIDIFEDVYCSEIRCQ